MYPLLPWIGNPVASPDVEAQSIHEPKENLVIRIDFNPHDAICAHVTAYFMDHHTNQIPTFLFSRPLPEFTQID